jgi:hypothetical protein
MRVSLLAAKIRFSDNKGLPNLAKKPPKTTNIQFWMHYEPFLDASRFFFHLRIIKSDYFTIFAYIITQEL